MDIKWDSIVESVEVLSMKRDGMKECEGVLGMK